MDEVNYYIVKTLYGNGEVRITIERGEPPPNLVFVYNSSGHSPLPVYCESEHVEYFKRVR